MDEYPQPVEEQRRRATDLPDDAPWWAKWLVANANQAFTWWSVQWPVVCGILIESYTAYGDELSAWLPATWMPHLAAIGFFLTALLRVTRQRRTP